MPEVKHEITSHLFSLESIGKFHKELNMISWDGRAPVYDLRGWNEDHTKMSKGVTFSDKEYEELVNKLNETVED